MIRTLAQLLVLFRDNMIRLITPASMRDFSETTFGAILTIDPTVNDDNVNTAGHGFFDSGSKWLNTATPSIWECVSGGVGAADWVKVYPAASAALTLVERDGVYIDETSIVGSAIFSAAVGQGAWPSGISFVPGLTTPLKSTGLGFVPNPSTHQIQFSVWVVNPNDDTGTIFQARDSGGYGLLLDWVSHTFRFGPQNAGGGFTFASISIPSGPDYIFVEGGFDTSTNTIWLSVNDGGRVTVPYVLTPNYPSLMWIGGDTADGITVTTPWNGTMDEMAWYSRQLTTAEVTQLYNSGCGCLWGQIPCSVRDGNFYYWPFDDTVPPYDDYILRATFVAGSNVPMRADGICGLRSGCIPAGGVTSVLPGTNVNISGPSATPTVSVPTMPAPDITPGTLPGGVLLPVGNLTGPGTISPTLLPAVNVVQLAAVTGTTTPSFVTYVHLSGANGLVGSLVIYNTSLTTDIQVNIHLTDLFGATADVNDTIAGGGGGLFPYALNDGSVILGIISGPWADVKVNLTDGGGPPGATFTIRASYLN